MEIPSAHDHIQLDLLRIRLLLLLQGQSLAFCSRCSSRPLLNMLQRGVLDPNQLHDKPSGLVVAQAFDAHLEDKAFP